MMHDIDMEIKKEKDSLESSESASDTHPNSAPNTPPTPGVSPSTPITSPPGSPTGASDPVEKVTVAPTPLDAFLSYSEEDWQHLEHTVLAAEPQVPQTNVQPTPCVEYKFTVQEANLTQEIDNWWN